MARYETIVCDQCEKRARIPATGWIRTTTPYGVFPDPADVVPGDWCGTVCLLAHFSDVVLQEPLDGLEAEGATGPPGILMRGDVPSPPGEPQPPGENAEGAVARAAGAVVAAGISMLTSVPRTTPPSQAKGQP